MYIHFLTEEGWLGKGWGYISFVFSVRKASGQGFGLFHFKAVSFSALTYSQDEHEGVTLATRSSPGRTCSSLGHNAHVLEHWGGKKINLWGVVSTSLTSQKAFSCVNEEVSCKGRAFPPTQSGSCHHNGHALWLWVVKISGGRNISDCLLKYKDGKKDHKPVLKISFPFQVNYNHLCKEKTAEM